MKDGSQNIINLYVRANENKEKIVKKDLPRSYSVAEITVLSCMDALFRHDMYSCYDDNWDVNKVIKMILLDSLRGKMDCLDGKDKYSNIIRQMDNPEVKESRLARISVLNTIMGFKDENKDLNNLLNKQLKLQTTIRQGHIYWGAKGKRLESILEHIYGTLILALGIESEHDYCIDFDKIFKMLLIHETEEITIGDLTEWDGVSPEEKIKLGKEAVKKIFKNTKNKDYYINLLDEFNSHDTMESQYSHLCDKLEYDMQVKMYELQGRYDFEHRPDNVVTRSQRVRQIIEDGASSVFDVHYEYDKDKYYSFPCLRRVLEETKNL